ncbi:MAG: Holliday junction branch migration protein RuvA [Planctomycetota bacterium]
MIEFVAGELVAKGPSAATVRVGGVGFRIHIPASTYDALPREGNPARLLTHLHVREDQLSLYGFASELERRLFLMLIQVSGISTTIALRALGSCSPAELKRMIMDEEADALRHMIKGVGKKTAERMVLELRDPVEELEVEAAPSAADQTARDAVEALVTLGEPRAEAERAVRDALEDLGPDAEQQQLVQAALAR